MTKPAVSVLAFLFAALVALAPAPVVAIGWGDDTPNASKDFGNAEKAVKAKDYNKAVELFEKVVKAEPNNADAFNYLGYSHRKLRTFDKALGYYQTALRLDPKHKGALEYLGELYLERNELTLAEEQLGKLKTLCPRGCEEYNDLKKAIDDHKASRKSS